MTNLNKVIVAGNLTSDATYKEYIICLKSRKIFLNKRSGGIKWKLQKQMKKLLNTKMYW